MNSNSKLLELLDIHTFYGETCILHGVSLGVEKGKVIALLGRNGAGKTTTIRSIIGFTPPRKGSIVFKGEDVTGLEPYQISRMGIGLVPQGRRIFPSLCVEENLRVAEKSRNQEKEWTLDSVYTLFPVLKKRAAVGAARLSGGEQQMLAIARALINNPDLLLMDEPSEGLAPIVVRQVCEVVKELKKRGLSILLVEQNLHMALELSDYVYILNMGKVVYECTPDELISNKEVRGKYLGVGD